MKISVNNTKKALLFSLLTAVLISLCGFGVMNVFWFTSSHDASLLGLYDFRAATIGDGLCLPVIVGSSFFILFLQNLKKNHNRLVFNKTSHFFGGIAAIIAAIVQISWLVSDSTKPNWTIPYAHYFTAAGWYHAFFFVFMFFSITVLLTQLWIERKELAGADYSYEEQIALILLWCFGAGFIFLFLIDDYGTEMNYIILLSLASIVLMFLFLVFCLCSNRQSWRKDVQCILSGVTSSYGIVLTLVGKAQVTPALGIGLLIIVFFTAAFIPINYKYISKNFLSYLLVVFPATSIFLARFFYGNIILKIIFAFLNIIIPFLLSATFKVDIDNGDIDNYDDHKVRDRSIEYKAPFLYSGVGLLASVIILPLILENPFFINNDRADSIFQMLLTVLLGVLAYRYIKYLFDKQIEAEHLKDKNRMEEKAFVKFKAITYMFMMSIAIGSILFWIIYVIKQTNLPGSMEISLAIPLNPIKWFYLIITVTSLFLLFLVGVLRKAFKSIKTIGSIAIILEIIAYLSLALFIFSIKIPLSFDKYKIANWCFAIFMVFGSAYMLSQGFYNNTVRIHAFQIDHKKYSKFMRVASFIMSMGIFGILAFIVFQSAFLPIILQTNGNILLGLLITITPIILAVLVIPVLICYALMLEPEEPTMITDNGRCNSVIQDGGLIFILILIGGLFPIFYGYIAGWFDTFMVLISLTINLSWIIIYCQKNNNRYLQDHKSLVLKSDTELSQRDKKVLYLKYRGLEKHLKMQNWMMLFIILPYSIIILANKITDIIYEGNKK